MVRASDNKRIPLPLDLSGNTGDMHDSIRELEFRLDDVETQGTSSVLTYDGLVLNPHQSTVHLLV